LKSESYRPGEMLAKTSHLGAGSASGAPTLATPGSGSTAAVPPLPVTPGPCGLSTGAFVPLFDLPARGAPTSATPSDLGDSPAKSSEAIRGNRGRSAVVDPAVGDQGEEDSDEEDDEELPQDPGGASSGGSPQKDSQYYPTVGSLGHPLRLCKPCAFVNTKGCKDGADCRFCHLCGPGEKKRRKKEKNALWRTVNVNRWPPRAGDPAGWT